MTSQRGRLLALWMAAIMLLSSVFVFAEPVMAAPAENETRITVIPPADVLVRRGRSFTIRAEVDGAFTGPLQWSVDGNTGTTIAHLETIPATTPGGITHVSATLRVASNETAHSLTVRLSAAGDVTGHVTVPISAALRDVMLYNGNQPLHSVFTFPARRPGYADISPITVTARNYDNAATGRLTVQLIGPDASAFRLSRTHLPSIPRDEYDTFTVAPNSGLASRSTPYRATVRVFNEQGDVDERFEVSFRVDENVTGETFTLTVVSGPGGRVGINDSNYSTSWSANFTPGSVIRIHARPNNNFVFDGWSMSPRAGNIANERRDSTTFTMPNRNVTITAHFQDWRWGDPFWDPRWGEWDRWDPRWMPTNWPPVHFPAPLMPPRPQQPSGPVGAPGPPAAPPPAVPLPTPPPNLPVHVPIPDPTTIHIDRITAATAVVRPIDAAINGERLRITEQPAGFVGNTVFVPVIDLFEHMHYAVDWSVSTVTFERYSISVSVTVGDMNFTTNGVNRRFSAAPVIVDGHLLVPAEIIESIGGIFHLDANGVLQMFVRV